MTALDNFNIFEVLITASLTVAGWFLRLIWSELKGLREEQKDFVSNTLCKMHREYIMRDINELRGKPSCSEREQ